ncbi:hypothetical protein NKF06_19965 [Haloferax sp. AB510]|uniref:hypothetical protein n=1 Tax=Haloferax sp. AB510 TaxID=2934172 RepID=UPI00209C3C66|nr:hypothetical protein [Haloferax sp. AB510]MCO8268788.1 hypothetical protein [Haloferax sp. AB510]
MNEHTADVRERIFSEESVAAGSAFVSKLTSPVGDVAVGPRSNLWLFVCLRGDGGSTTVGEKSSV